MSKDLNVCHFIGRLGKEPDLRSTPNGTAVCKFNIACGDDYKDKNSNQMISQTNWVNVVMFGRLAEICGEFLSKGSRVYIQGKFTVRKWQDQSGADRWSTEVVASEMQMLDSRGDQQGAQQAPVNNAQPKSTIPEDFDDDIPF